MKSEKRNPRVTYWLVGLVCFIGVTDQALTETVEVNDFEMYYEIHGEGEPLVLLHGFSGTGRSEWGQIAGALSSEYQLIIPDLRGHGLSTNPSRKFTHKQSALDVFALLDHLGLDQVKGIGFSTGGMTLLHMATQQPDRIEAMILRGSSPYFTEQDREVKRATSLETQSEERMRELRELHKHGEQQIADLIAQFNAFKDNYDDMNFKAQDLSTIKARTLIVHGDRDRFFPVQVAVEMYEGIPGSALWIAPNAGHGAGMQRDPRHFVRVATAFFKNELRGDRYGR